MPQHGRCRGTLPVARRAWPVESKENSCRPCQTSISKVGTAISVYPDIEVTNFDIEVLKMDFDIGTKLHFDIEVYTFDSESASIMISKTKILRNFDVDVVSIPAF